MNIEQRVFQVISESICCEESLITSSTELMNLEMDSLDFVELLMDLEDEFIIEISDEVAKNELNTVGDIVNYVTKTIK